MDVSRIRTAVAAAGVLLAVAACAGETRKEPFALVSMDEVERMLAQSGVFVVDANPKDVFQKNHLPGARWWRSAALAQILPAEKDRPVVFYCASPS